MGLLSDILKEHKKAGTKPTHSPIGASAAHRYINCPGSVAKSIGIHEEESEYALEGTIAHEVAEYCLKNQEDAWEHLNDGVPQEMVEAVQIYLDYCRNLFDSSSEDPDAYIEEPVCASSVHELLYGTCDFAVVSPNIVTVVDFKYGAGIAVDAVGNPQGRIYARGLIDRLEIRPRHIQIVIVQPRAVHTDGPIREEWLTLEELTTWENEVLKPALKAVDAKKPLVVPGDHCRFCPSRSRCEELANSIHIDEEIMAEKPESFSDEELGRVLEKATRVQILVKALKSEALKRMLNGKQVPGQKLVKNKSDRVFKDGALEMADIMFGDDAWAPKKLKSPAQMEKLVDGKDFVSEWAYKPDTGLTIAPESDKREAVSRHAKDVFKDVT